MSDVPFLDVSAMTAEVRPELDRVWQEVVDTSRFIGGAMVDSFESDWASYCGTSEAIGLANGTDALVLALRALDIGPGDEVLVPANTFIATAEAVVLAGATPRFVDVDDETLLITAEGVRERITPRTRALMVVHLYGQMPDMDALRAVTDSSDIALIEDAAQAHGATWLGRPAGSFGRVACFSFYPGKNLGAFGDGGAVVTSDSMLAARIRCMRDHGRENGSHYVHTEIGTNSRLDALQAGVLSAKLARLASWNSARRDIMAAYREALADTDIELVTELPGSLGVYHLAVARSARRDDLRADLEARGVATSIHYPVPCHEHPPYQRYADTPMPVAERAAGEILSLPMFPHMTAAQVTQVCEALRSVATREVRRAG